MKKKIIAIIFIILIIISVLIVIDKIKSEKIDYEITQIESYNYVKYSENEKFGVIDRDGKIVIQAQYKDIIIPNPEKDIFICYEDDKSKNIILNSSNEKIFTEYDSIEPIQLKNIVSVLCYEKDVLKYEKDGLYGLIDFLGKEITKNVYDSIENLQSTEGKFLVSKNGKYGVINLKGTVLVKENYDAIRTDEYYTEKEEYTKSGFITAIKTDDGYRYGYVNYEGKTILKGEYNSVIRITDNEEIYLIASKNGQYGLYKNEKEIIKPEYQSISYCDNGGLIIQKNKKYGIANLKGDVLVEIKYTNIYAEGIYLYAESSNEKQVYDINGNKIDINFSKVVYETENDQYRIFTLFNNNVTYYGIENADGTTLVSSNYKYIEYVYSDYFVAKDNTGNLGVIDSKGNVLIDFKYDTLQKVKGKNILQALNVDTNETDIYSVNLEQVYTMKNATVSNFDGYVSLSNDKEVIYFDTEGNKITENSEILKNAIIRNLPEKIGDYKKVQKSLDDVYYEKK